MPTDFPEPLTALTQAAYQRTDSIEKSTAYHETSTVHSTTVTIEYPDRDPEDSSSIYSTTESFKTVEKKVEVVTKGQETSSESFERSVEQEWPRGKTTSRPSLKFKATKARLKQENTESFKTIRPEVVPMTSPKAILATTQGRVVPKFKLKFVGPLDYSTTESSNFEETTTLTSENTSKNIHLIKSFEKDRQINETRTIPPNEVKVEEDVEYYGVYEYYDPKNPDITLWEVETGTTQVVKLTKAGSSNSNDVKKSPKNSNLRNGNELHLLI